MCATACPYLMLQYLHSKHYKVRHTIGQAQDYAGHEDHMKGGFLPPFSKWWGTCVGGKLHVQYFQVPQASKFSNKQPLVIGTSHISLCPWSKSQVSPCMRVRFDNQRTNSNNDYDTRCTIAQLLVFFPLSLSTSQRTIKHDSNLGGFMICVCKQTVCTWRVWYTL